MVMRWKILELAEQNTTLEGLLRELKKHPEYGLTEESGIALLLQYADILPEAIQNELEANYLELK